MDPAGQPNLASIIIPTYNRASLLNEALACAAGQTYRPLEIIVVDDGSIDDTPAVVDHWRQQLGNDPRATVRYCHQSNSGVGAARNRGLIESKGEFIQFLDSDDILNSDKLRLHIACLQPHSECGYIFSDWARLENPHTWAQVSADGAAEIDSAELYCSLRVHWTMLGVYRRKTCYMAGPYSEDLVSGEDKEFNLRVLLSTAKVIYLPGVLCASRLHAGPRITDAIRADENKLALALPRLRRMTESAATEGRLNNSRLVRALVKELTGVIVEALEIGRPDLAGEAIEICRKMPVGLGRRARLTGYQILCLLPKGAFGRLWMIWLKARRAILEVPGRIRRALQ